MKQWLSAGRYWLFHPYLAFPSRLVLGGVFVYAGWSKIGLQVEMIQTVKNYNVLPDLFIQPFAYTLPWLELIAGSLLILGVLLASASSLLALVNLSFLIALGINLWRGTSIDCGCFGHSPEPLTWGVFARDVGFLLMSLQILVAGAGSLSLPGAISALRRLRVESGVGDQETRVSRGEAFAGPGEDN